MSYFLESDRLYYREVKVSDIEDGYYSWMNDRTVVQFLESRHKPVSKENLRDYILERNGDTNGLFLAIVDKEKNKHIGNIKLGPINSIHRYGDIGIILGEKKYWGKGLATEAIETITNFGFKNLDLNKITAGCYENNVGSLKAFQKAGFEIEYVQKKQYLFEGKFINAFRLCRFKDSFLPK
jgi:[ribosomal protein S5]-alanine N-acetyltransferase